jgi:beta-fructofuranosidase
MDAVMGLHLPDKWLWDFWLAKDRGDYHIFFLQAPRALGDERQRHWHVSIGHAVSQNLRDWEVLPDALHPSEPNAWDDYTTWTGSVIRNGSGWRLFYTGTSRRENGLIQRIGLASSTDLVHWEKHPHNPLVAADSRWYELLDLNMWHDQAWRDPWVFRHPKRGTFHAFITARRSQGDAMRRGVIGHAHSKDLIEWEVLPPIAEPGDFGQMEVPQLVSIGGLYYLLFSTRADDHSDHRKERTGRAAVTGTHYLVAKDPLGPFHFTTDEFLVGTREARFYSGKLVEGPQGNWFFLAFRNFDAHGNFVGDLTDPLPITVDDAGSLAVDWGAKRPSRS